MEKQRDKAAKRAQRKLNKGHLGDSMIETDEPGGPLGPTDETASPTGETTPTE